MVGSPGLSVRQAQMLTAIEAHYAELGRPPSYKELGPRVGLEKSQTHDLVKQLARAGRLTIHRTCGIRTQIRLVDRLAEIGTAALADELARRAGNDPEDSNRQQAA